MWVLRWAEEYDFERFKKEELSMPRVKANNITMNYDQQGSGEPLILIPYLAADHALCIPGGRVRQAFHLHLAGSSRDWRDGDNGGRIQHRTSRG